MTEPIIIQKSSIDEIRIEWREFKGHKYLDIRTYTEKGITLAPRLVVELRRALATMDKSRVC